MFDANSVEQGSDANICSLHTLEINWNSCTKDDFLNSDISPTEVSEAIHHRKANKAADPDGIIPEVYKYTGDKIIPFLVHLFNTIFTSGEYPEAWTEAIILPLYKKGSIHDPDNYRGISLLNVCSKLDRHIINKRVSRWAEDCDVLGDIQAGFRKDNSTIDHIFALFSIIQRQLLRNKKLYVAFIDFRKALQALAYLV